MVLTLQGAGKQLKPLATGAVSSGGGSGSGKLVPAILLTITERERAHERPGHEKNVKQSPVGCDTHWNTVATGRTPRRRSRPELEKREELWRLRGLGRELGGALIPQGDGEDTGLLNLARGELGTVDFREREMSSFSGRGQRTRMASSTSVLKWRGRQARDTHVAWRPWQQAAACTHACARRCSRGSCAGQGAGDPYRITVATPILPLLSPCEFQPKFELKFNCHQNKSCAKFCKLQIIFRCPKLILNGKRLILPDSLEIKLNSKEIQIFELGQIMISRITFNLA